MKPNIFGDVNVSSPPRYLDVKYQAVSRDPWTQQNLRRCPPPAFFFSLPTFRMMYTRRRWWVVGAAAATVGTLVGAAPRRPVSCDFVCKGGGCAYSNCGDGPSCPGGACSFENCDRPSCRGGNCDFTACRSPVCHGGNCRFVDPLSTLRDGYCDGGACKVNGRPFPSRFEGKLST